MKKWIIGSLAAALAVAAVFLWMRVRFYASAADVHRSWSEAANGAGTAAPATPENRSARQPESAPAAPAQVPGRSPAPVSAAGSAARASALPGLNPVSSESWGEGKFFGFSPEEWRDMAERCELRWQLPPFGSTPELLSEEDAARFGMSASQRELYNRILAQENQQFSDQMRSLYREMTGDPGTSSSLLLHHVLADLRRSGGDAEAHRRLAQELAGDAKAGDSIYERFMRAQLGAGDRLQAELNRQLGPALARSLREDRGPKFTLTGCGTGGLFRSERMRD